MGFGVFTAAGRQVTADKAVFQNAAYGCHHDDCLEMINYQENHRD